MIGIRDELLKPDNVLKLLLLADVLVPINRFSMFLQKKNLTNVEISCKFNQLLPSIEKVVNDDGSLFKEHAMEFLKTSQDCLELVRRTRGSRLLDKDEDLQQYINVFKTNVKEPFLRDVLVELKKQITIDDPIFQEFDVFNVADSHSQEEKLEMINMLKMFYGSQQSSSFEGETKDADPLIKIDISEEMVQNFFIEFRIQTKHLEKKCNKEIKVLVLKGKIKNPEGYKDEHPISPDKVYKAMYPEKDRYATLMHLFKFSLLIPSSTANIE